MLDIEKINLEMTAYESAMLRHALALALIEWRHEKSRKAIERIDTVLKEVGIGFLHLDEIAKGKILHKR